MFCLKSSFKLDWNVLVLVLNGISQITAAGTFIAHILIFLLFAIFFEVSVWPLINMISKLNWTNVQKETGIL